MRRLLVMAALAAAVVLMGSSYLDQVRASTMTPTRFISSMPVSIRIPCFVSMEERGMGSAVALFFGAAQKAMSSLGAIAERTRVLIIRLEQVPTMDATGLVALESAIAQLSKNGCLAILTGLQPQPRELMEKARILESSWSAKMA